MCVNPRTRVKMVEYVNHKMKATIVSVNLVTKEKIVIKVGYLLWFMPYPQRCRDAGRGVYSY